MPKSLHQDAIDRIQQTHAPEPVLSLVHISVDVTTTATPTGRFVNYHEEVSFGGKTYRPYPMTLGTYRESNDGSLSRLELSLDNSTRTFARHLHSYKSAFGRPVNIYMIPRDLAGSVDKALWKAELEIGEVSLTNKTVQLTLQPQGLMDLQSSQIRVVAHRCQARFAGEICGYALGPNAAFSDCGKTFDDCRARGEDMVLRSFPRLHPQRFWAFPTVPKRSS